MNIEPTRITALDYDAEKITIWGFCVPIDGSVVRVYNCLGFVHHIDTVIGAYIKTPCLLAVSHDPIGDWVVGRSDHINF